MVHRAWLLVAALAAVGCDDAGDDGVSPRIDLLAPPQAEVGDVVEILGIRFCGPGFIPPPPQVDGGGPIPDGGGAPDAMPPPDASPPDAGPPADAGPPPDGGAPMITCNPNGFVTFGSHAGLTPTDSHTLRWSDTRITVRVPNVPPGATGVVVTVDGRQSLVADFTVIE